MNTSEIVPFGYYEEEVMALNIYERIELAKTIRKERESIIMTKLVYLIVALNVIAIAGCMVLIMFKMLEQ